MPRASAWNTSSIDHSHIIVDILSIQGPLEGFPVGWLKVRCDEVADFGGGQAHAAGEELYNPYIPSMIIVREPIDAAVLTAFAKEKGWRMVKLVVDIEKDILAYGSDLHADMEEALRDDGSQDKYLWGINYFPGRPPGERVEYTAMMNMRPFLDHLSQEIQFPEVRERVQAVLVKLIRGL